MVSMRYKLIYMPHPNPQEGEWLDTKEEAYDKLANMTCGFGTGELCEMCQAEWDVFSEQELNEIENEETE